MEQLGGIDHSKDFASSVAEIINQPLTVENVDTYAEAALDKLIQLIDDMVQVYNRQPTIWLDNPAEKENAMFNLAKVVFPLPDLAIKITLRQTK